VPSNRPFGLACGPKSREIHGVTSIGVGSHENV
jgi:hypothetical protein